LHLVGFFYIIVPTLMMHGQTQIKFMEVFECILNEKESEITEYTIRVWMGPPPHTKWNENKN
jgi:hypothetical protein